MAKHIYTLNIDKRLKEADETAYWLELLSESSIIDKKQFDSLYSDLDEIISLLISIIIFSASCLISDKTPFAEKVFFKVLINTNQRTKLTHKTIIAKIIIFFI